MFERRERERREQEIGDGDHGAERRGRREWESRGSIEMMRLKDWQGKRRIIFFIGSLFVIDFVSTEV